MLVVIFGILCFIAFSKGFSDNVNKKSKKYKSFTDHRSTRTGMAMKAQGRKEAATEAVRNIALIDATRPKPEPEIVSIESGYKSV